MERGPVVTELSGSLSAADTFRLFHTEPFAFFLDSGMNPADLGRYSFIGVDPFLVFKSRGDRLIFADAHGSQTGRGDPFEALRRLLSEYAIQAHDLPTPLPAGAVGYLGYDLCHFIEHLPATALDDLRIPDCCLAFYDVAITFDHAEGRAYIVSSGLPERDERERLDRAERRLKETEDRLLTALRQPHPPAADTRPGVGTNLRSNFTRQGYLGAVEAAREYIAAGDIFQVNLSQRFESDFLGDPYDLYQHLRSINPAPFAAYLGFDDVVVVSASPERFLKVNGDLVETRPMKGTRPRGTSTAEDERLARELLNSVKDRAENVMIVDLERNDLGRVCRFGTVQVRELWTLEKYATVFQLTSTVEGRLAEGKDRIDLLRACFPGGSITGAPKVRAMEIIDELEPTRRGVYTGCIGYLSFSGEMDLNIVIRTILIKDGKAYFQVGGAVTYDSEPEREYQETMDKAKALFQVLSVSPWSPVVTS